MSWWTRYQRHALLGMAVLAGGLAAWAAHHHLGAVTQALTANARQPMGEAVVAARDLASGAVLDADAAAIREVPLAWLPRDAVLPDDFAAAQGARLARDLPRGEVLLWAHLAAARAAPLSAQLATGRRAVTIAVDEINSLSGMLEPGDLIDLYVSFEHGGRRVTAPLLANVRVLATGRQHGAQGGEDASGFATLTLDASPEDGVRLVAARQQGTLSAMLRHAQDGSAPAPAQAADLAHLLGLERAPPAAPRDVPVVFGDQGPRAIPGLSQTSRAGRAQDGVPQGSDPGTRMFDWAAPEGTR